MSAGDLLDRSRTGRKVLLISKKKACGESFKGLYLSFPVSQLSAESPKFGWMQVQKMGAVINIPCQIAQGPFWTLRLKLPPHGPAMTR